MISNYCYIHNTRSIVVYLKQLRNDTIGYKSKPIEFNTKEYILESVENIIKEM